MRNGAYGIAAVIFLVFGCGSDLPRVSNLEKPRILAMRSSQPTLNVGDISVFDILLHDPQWRSPEITWILSLDFQDSAGTFDIGDLPIEEALAANEKLIPVGRGVTVAVAAPPIPEDVQAQLAAAQIEVLPVPLAAVVDFADGTRLVGFKFVKLQLPAGSQAFLATEDSYANATTAEQQELLADRIQLVHNQNPTIASLTVSSSTETLSIDDRNLLDVRKGVDTNSGSLSTVPEGFVRYHLPITDADNQEQEPAPIRGEAGYNLLSVNAFMQEALRISLDLETTDFVFDRIRGDAVEAKFDPLPKGLYYGAMVASDGKGGIDWKIITADVEAAPPSTPALGDGEQWGLVRSDGVAFWSALTSTTREALSAVSEATVLMEGIVSSVDLQNDINKNGASINGVPFVLEQAKVVDYNYDASATGSISDTTDINWMLSAPNNAESLYAGQITLPVRLIRFAE